MDKVERLPAAVGDDHESRLARWLVELREASVDIIVITGDIVDNPSDEDGLHRARGLLEQSEMAWKVVPGNHDVRLQGDDPFYRVFPGPYPRLERCKGVDFVLVDSMAGLPRDAPGRALERLLDATVVGCLTEGALGESARADVEGMLKQPKGPPRVLLLHHHVTHQPAHKDYETIAGTMKPIADAHWLLDRARELGLDSLLHGHHHTPQLAIMGGTIVANAGSSTASDDSVVRIFDFMHDSSEIGVIGVAKR